jgi:predicted PhzF superfamily epimerase YddE/YHI9
MATPFYLVDSFTAEPYAGNPAGVCFVQDWPSEKAMMALAGEMSLAEIAYLQEDGQGYRLRWFSPKVEVQLCGHATLASAHIVWETARRPQDGPLRFETLSGELTAEPSGDQIALDFPLNPATAGEIPAWLADELGETRWCGQAVRDLLVELPSEAAVREYRPDLATLEANLESCLLLTARSDEPGYDFVSRFFAPRYGIPEDPVTGSAHCVLGPYWSHKLGKGKLRGFQASARGGAVGVDLEARPGRALLTGQAVTILRGETTSLA